MKQSGRAYNDIHISGYSVLMTGNYLWETVDSERYIDMLNLPYLEAPEWLNVQPFKK